MLIKITNDAVKMFKNGELHLLAHGCNCHNIMGAGIAKTIRNAYPEVFEIDAKYNLPKGRARLGTFSIYEKQQDALVLNFYTQETIWNRKMPDGSTDIPFEIDAFQQCLDNLVIYLEDIDKKQGLKNKFNLKEDEKIRFGMPYIGCGLAGGEKKDVEALLEKFSETKFVKDNLDIYLIDFKNWKDFLIYLNVKLNKILIKIKNFFK